MRLSLSLSIFDGKVCTIRSHYCTAEEFIRVIDTYVSPRDSFEHYPIQAKLCFVTDILLEPF